MSAPKLTDDLRERVSALIRAGNTIETACSVVGITSRTYRAWVERGTHSGSANTEYRAFREAVMLARAESEAALVAQVGREATRSWRAAAALLERRFPERWALPSERLASRE